MSFEKWWEEMGPIFMGHAHLATEKNIAEAAWDACKEEFISKVTHHHDLSAEDSASLRHTMEKMP